jgi:hypothetical protein
VDEGLSPAVMRKAVTLATKLPSFRSAAESVEETLEIDLGAKRLERLARRIGGERVAERESCTAAWESLPLVSKLASPTGVKAPAAVAVMCDGGRMQRWDLPETAKSHWCETKVGALLELAPRPHDSDPCPEVPDRFLDLGQMDKLAREIKRVAAKGSVFQRADASEPAAAAADVVAEAREKVVAEPPEVLSRDVVATLAANATFGKHLAARAWSLGFSEALLKAFVADGQGANWTLWEQHFKHHGFVPILDFIHALSYVFAAAMAGRTPAEGGPVYVRWITWVWQGDVLRVIAELASRAAELGPVPAEAGETDPRRIVAETLTYLTNQQSRMSYPTYRRMGLPITSSHIESTVKQINYRVKGTEKFWGEDGGESLLQLRADQLSDTRPLASFWPRRSRQATGTRSHPSRRITQKAA